MKQIFTSSNLKIFISALLIISLVGYFYFEASLILRFAVVALGLISLWQISSTPEIAVLTVLYLFLYDLYNIHYGIGIPTSVMMVAVFAISYCLFFVHGVLIKFKEGVEQKLFDIFNVVTSLVLLELFLTMGFWPVDPRTKSFVIVVTYYLISRIIYLFAKNMLSLRRALGYMVVSFIVLSLIIFLNLKLNP